MAKESILLVSIAVVLVQSGTVDGPAHGTGNKSPLHADPVDKDGREDAEQAHEAEDQGVSGIDEVGLQGASSTERVVCILSNLVFRVS